MAGKDLTCEGCGDYPVMTKDGLCFSCNKEVEGERPLPDRSVEYRNLSDEPGSLPQINVVSQTSHSWTSEARHEPN